MRARPSSQPSKFLPAPNARAKLFLCLHSFAAAVLIFYGLTAHAQTAQSRRVPEAYRQVRLAMGRGDYAEAHRRMRRLFEAEKEKIYPPLFETAAYLFAYEKSFAAGHIFFDSLRAAGHHRGNVAGAQAILWQTQQQPDSSLKHARQAVLENSQCVYPYDIFIEKSFEQHDATAAYHLLTQQCRQHPENWRLRYALGIWYTLQNQLKAACDTLYALLQQGFKHWRIYYVLGLKLEDLRKWPEALQVHQAGVTYCEAMQEDEGRARLLHGRAQAEGKLGQWQAAIQTLLQGLQLSQRVGSRLSEGKILLLLGQIQSEHHQWLEARQNLLIVAQRARQYSEGNMLLQAYHSLAELNRKIGKRSEALDYTFKAHQVADSLGMKDYALSLLNNIGVIDLEAGRKIQALEHLLEILRLARSQKADRYLSFYLQNLASVLNALGRYDDALKYWTEADEIVQKNYDFDQLLKLKILRSEILMHLGQSSMARALLQQAATTAKNTRHMTLWFRAQILLAQMEMQAQQLTQAKARLAQTQAAAPQELPYETHLKIASLLAEIAWQTGDTARALATYQAALNTIAGQTHRLGPRHLASLSGVEREIFFNLSRAYVHGGDLDRALPVTERARFDSETPALASPAIEPGAN